MATYKLSRSSFLYKFVFGQEWRMDGFPEPRNDRISLGLFLGLVLFMIFMRPLAFVMMTIMEITAVLVCFLMDGSYCRGRFPTTLEIVEIKSWPKVYGHRLSPWLILAVAVVCYQYFYIGVGEAFEFLIFFVLITLVTRSIKPGDKSPAMELAEAIEPVVDEKLRLSYYRESKLFPTIQLVI